MLLTQATFYVLIIIGNIVTASTPECEPRDEVAAARNCKKACLQDGTCRKKNKECVCDGLCGLSCLRKRCPPLTAPPNGNMIVNPIDRTIGAEVSYSCNDGYVISGQTNRICQANKTWSGTEPMCTNSATEGWSGIEASNLKGAWRNKDSASLDGRGFPRPCNINDLSRGNWNIMYHYPTRRYESEEVWKREGTIAILTCNEIGYVTDGPNTLTCRHGTWHERIPFCERSRCQTSYLEDGMLRYYGSDGTVTSTPRHGDYRIASCNEGYSLEGTPSTQCVEGEWIEELPTCTETCPNGCEVPSLEHGYFTVRYNQLDAPLQPKACVTSAQHIYARCQRGWTLQGRAYYYTCQQSGEWLNPEGVDLTCGRCLSGQCLVPYIENGHFQSTRDRTTLANGTCFGAGEYLRVVCDDGMQLTGSAYYLCIGGEIVTRNSDNVLTSCSRVSSGQEQRCPNPEDAYLVETFVGSDFTPLNEQEIFREGDFITSRCKDPKRQQFRGSVTSFCEGEEWSGDPAECESTNFVFSVGNTVMQGVREDGTIVVYPSRGYVTVNCNLNGLQGIVTMHYQETSSVIVGRGYTRWRHIIRNPSQSNSGRYRCESNGRSHSINVLFEAINCPPPSRPSDWDHNRVPANRDGSLGYIFTETLSLRCPRGFTSSNPVPNRCTHHGTWSNMSQRCIRN